MTSWVVPLKKHNTQSKITLEILKQSSSKQTIKCGIPQGSSLGPLLFLLYINDIPNCSDKLSFRIFADDTNIFASSSNAVELQSLINQELSKVKEWCDFNKLSINLTKTNYMIIKSPKRKTNIISLIGGFKSP